MVYQLFKLWSKFIEINFVFGGITFVDLSFMSPLLLAWEILFVIEIKCLLIFTKGHDESSGFSLRTPVSQVLICAFY
jgi:hypothetical protein